MEWAVLDWNEGAIRFYDRLGATPNDWLRYGWTRPNFEGSRATGCEDLQISWSACFFVGEVGMISAGLLPREPIRWRTVVGSRPA
jgi:hypothetical protein